MRSRDVFRTKTLVVRDVLALPLGMTTDDVTLGHLVATLILHLLHRLQRTRASGVSDRLVSAVNVLDRQVFVCP